MNDECVIEKGPGWVYILHFDEPIEHARHYIGSSNQLTQRLYAHAVGRGATLTQVAFFRGIGFRIGYVGQARRLSPRSLERRAKHWHGAYQFCAICCEGRHMPVPGTQAYPVALLPYRCSASVVAHVERTKKPAPRRPEPPPTLPFPTTEETTGEQLV